MPTLLISAGFAGGLQPGLKAGDLILGENHSDPDVVSRLSLHDGWRIGCVSTAESILESAEDKRFLGLRTGCLAGDLETAHLARICGDRGLPMLSVRCISDAMEDDLPVPADVLLNPKTGRPDSLALFRHLISRPSSVAGFNKLLKNSRVAQDHLARGLEEILLSSSGSRELRCRLVNSASQLATGQARRVVRGLWSQGVALQGGGPATSDGGENALAFLALIVAPIRRVRVLLENFLYSAAPSVASSRRACGQRVTKNSKCPIQEDPGKINRLTWADRKRPAAKLHLSAGGEWECAREGWP
jgi:adenosylhomocysteine nucleosidase